MSSHAQKYCRASNVTLHKWVSAFTCATNLILSVWHFMLNMGHFGQMKLNGKCDFVPKCTTNRTGNCDSHVISDRTKPWAVELNTYNYTHYAQLHTITHNYTRLPHSYTQVHTITHRHTLFHHNYTQLHTITHNTHITHNCTQLHAITHKYTQ